MDKAMPYTIRLYKNHLTKVRTRGRKVGVSAFIRDLIDKA